jgi:hypothetical protein
MRAFRQVALAVGSVLLVSSVAFSQARLGLYVLDSNGLMVGHAQDATHVVSFLPFGVPVLLSVGGSGFTAQTYNLYFTDGSCGTQALLNAGQPDQLFGSGYYTTDGMIRYFAPNFVVNTPLLSALTVQTDGTFSACGPVSVSLPVAPAVTASSSIYAPPFLVADTRPVSPAPGTATFNDVPTTHPFFQFIEALHASGITGGCQASPPLYCPDNPVTRGQMAVFLAKALGL